MGQNRDAKGRFTSDHVYAAGYKGFNHDWSCTPSVGKSKVYAVGKTFEEPGGYVCNEGVMHATLNICRVFDFYRPIDRLGNLSKYARVLALAPVDIIDDKFATAKLKIDKELNFQKITALVAAATPPVQIRKYLYAFKGNFGSCACGNMESYIDLIVPKCENSSRPMYLFTSGKVCHVNMLSRGQVVNLGEEAVIDCIEDIKVYSSGNRTCIFCNSPSTVICAGNENHVYLRAPDSYIKGVLGTEIKLGFSKRTLKIDGDRYKPNTMYLFDGSKLVEQFVYKT